MLRRRGKCAAAIKVYLFVLHLTSTLKFRTQQQIAERDQRWILSVLLFVTHQSQSEVRERCFHTKYFL